MSDDQDGCEWVSFFWYRPTRVVPDQRLLNGCVCVCTFSMLTLLIHRQDEYLGQKKNPVSVITKGFLFRNKQ